MKESKRDLVRSAFFIIIISTAVSNLYQPVWRNVYEIVNLLVPTLFSLFKDSWFIKKIVLLLESLFLVFLVDINHFIFSRKYSLEI